MLFTQHCTMTKVFKNLSFHPGGVEEEQKFYKEKVSTSFRDLSFKKNPQHQILFYKLSKQEMALAMIQGYNEIRFCVVSNVIQFHTFSSFHFHGKNIHIVYIRNLDGGV